MSLTAKDIAEIARLLDESHFSTLDLTVGDFRLKVDEESVIGIIEVMKLMNSVRAGVAGTVVAILAQNGSAVEEGQPLVRVRKG